MNKKEVTTQWIFDYDKTKDRKRSDGDNERDHTMEKQFIEQKAQELLDKVEYSGGELDVVNAANELGFTVGISALPKWDDGFILVDNVKEHIRDLIGILTDKAIGVNADRDLQKKRFIIAHEIGHYILHYKEDGVLYARREDKKGKDAEENDADFFAACFLMPKKYFKEKADELKGKGLSKRETIILLQDYFNAPYESVKRRLAEIA